MSSLIGLLNLGANALQANNAGVAVTANNIANATTDGYSRQRVDLESQLGSPLVGGVRVAGVDRLSSDLLAGRIRGNASSLSVADAFASALLDLESSISAGGELGPLVANFFSSVDQVSSAPTDLNLREAAVAAARSLALGLQQHAQAAAEARQESNERIREQLAEANRLIHEIAQANQGIQMTGDATLRDRRDQAGQELASLVGATARIDPDGQMRVTMNGGEVLVDGNRGAQLAAAPDPADPGADRVEVVDGSHRRDVTGLIDGGRVGGELRMRDQAAPAVQGQLDQLAFDISTRINEVHRENVGLDGGTGRNLFAQPTEVAGAAAAMAVDPDLVGDSRLLGTGRPGGGTGDNRGAQAISDLADQPLASGGRRTFAEAGIEVATDVGRSAAEAAIDRDFFAAQGDHLSGLRDSASGVSLQEEMSNLNQFQHAAEAQAEFLSTVDELLGTIIERL